MAKKEYREVPESELTEEEVRRGFNRLRELYKEAREKLHERKIERSRMNVMICELKHDRYVLWKENKRLNYLIEQANKKIEKKEKPVKEKKKENTNLVDFRKKFFDSL